MRRLWKTLILCSLLSGCMAGVPSGTQDKIGPEEEPCMSLGSLQEQIGPLPRADQMDARWWIRDYRAQADRLCAEESVARCRWLGDEAQNLGSYPADTEGRTLWLSNYGNLLLAAEHCEAEAKLLDRGFESDPLYGPGSYAIDVRGRMDGCFSDANRTLSPDFDLADDEDMETMKLQVEYTVSFLRDFHLAMDGRKTPLFSEVALCPARLGDGDLTLTGDVLTVGVDFWWWSGGDPEAELPQHLLELWNEGEHIDEDDPIFEYWAIANPIGIARRVLRRVIAGVADKVASKLDQVITGDGNGTIEISVDGLLEEFFQNDLANAVDFKSDVRARFGGLSEENKQRVLEKWKAFVEDPVNWEGLAQAILTAPLVRSQYNIELTQVLCGFVSHGNFHNINVDVHAALFPEATPFMRFVEVEQVEQNITVNQWLSLGCTYSIDDVGVNLSLVDYRGSLEKAGLERALDAVAGAATP